MLFVVIALLFYVLVARFFQLQIVESGNHTSELDRKIRRTVPIEASRGMIYDRYGRPLAINESIYLVEIERSMFSDTGEPLIVTANASRQKVADESLGINNLNEVLLNLIRLLEKNGEEFIDTMPVSKTMPFTYTVNSETRELRYIQDVLGKDKEWLTAPELMENLRKNYGIPEEWSDIDARNVLSLRCELAINRYLNYQANEVAKNVGYETVVAIEENANEFYGVQIETESLRYYPDGEIFSNLIGYTGKISDSEFTNLKSEGYGQNDIIGKQGMEKAFESELRGTDGVMTVEVNNKNRKVGVVSEEDPIPGNKVYLTIDKNFQIQTYEILIKYLKSVLISKINDGRKSAAYTELDILSSIIYTNNLSVIEIFESPEDTVSRKVRDYILEENPEIDVYTRDGFNEVRTILKDEIMARNIKAFDVVMVLAEQGIFEDDELLQRLDKGNISVKNYLITQIENDVLTPAMVGLDPYSASAVVLDVNTGETLAAVGYPNFDNNLFANSVDAQYLNKIFQDKTAPMINRPYGELLAPGSVFKMITGIAGMETGAITPNTLIFDKVQFTEAGKRYPTCMSTVGHQSINVSTALEVSCNYFFYDVSYRLGARTTGVADEKNIDVLNKYMMEFGLNDRAGVEIPESKIGVNDSLNVSSPSLRLAKEGIGWTDNNTILTAIGQDLNAYSPAVMAKYISTLASRGTRYRSSLLKKVETSDGKLVSETLPEIENQVNLEESTWDAIYKGLYSVVNGERGTARNAFADFPITVAGKTGTAELYEGKDSHTTFGGFAPYENPEIAVYVMVPSGDHKGMAASSEIARDIISAYMNLESEENDVSQKNVLVK